MLLIVADAVRCVCLVPITAMIRPEGRPIVSADAMCFGIDFVFKAQITEWIAPACMQAKLEPTGQRPATMERAAAADAAADCLAEAGGVAGSSHCRSCCCNGGSSSESGGDGSGSQGHNVATPATPTPDDVEFCLRQPQQPGQSAMPSRQQQQKKKFGVGASEDVDASYAASQRLLMLAGVTLRQHTLQRSIRLGPG